MQSQYPEQSLFSVRRSACSQSYVFLPEMTHDYVLKRFEFWVESDDLLRG